MVQVFLFLCEYRNSAPSLPLFFHLFHVPSGTIDDMGKHGGLISFRQGLKVFEAYKILKGLSLIRFFGFSSICGAHELLCVLREHLGYKDVIEYWISMSERISTRGVVPSLMGSRERWCFMKKNSPCSGRRLNFKISRGALKPIA